MANIWQERKKQRPEGLKVTFETGTTISIGSTTKIVKDVEIVSMVDDVINKKVIVAISGGSFYTLWEGTTYDAIGNWTNEQAVARLKELILEGK
jgi:hypothetical protein